MADLREVRISVFGCWLVHTKVITHEEYIGVFAYCQVTKRAPFHVFRERYAEHVETYEATDYHKLRDVPDLPNIPILVEE